MMNRAIETQYAGYRFRSRLEARWAVFFDALKLSWLYEPEGFVLPRGQRYLPDFLVKLNGKPYWFEIKPGKEQPALFGEFMANGSEEWRGAVLNDIPDPRFVQQTRGYRYYPEDSDRPYCLWGGPDGGWDNNYRFCVCTNCGEIGYQFDGLSERIDCGCSGIRNPTPDHPIILNAFVEARSARFEHDARERF